MENVTGIDPQDILFWALFCLPLAIIFYFWIALKYFFPKFTEYIKPIMFFLFISSAYLLYFIVPLISFLVNFFFGFSIIDYFTNHYIEIVCFHGIVSLILITIDFHKLEDINGIFIASIIILTCFYLLYLWIY